MIGVWVNKPNTMEAYIPERTIFLQHLKENLERWTLALAFLESLERRILEWMRGFDL